MGESCLHAKSRGECSPVVVMEAAIWDFSLTWSLVQPQVASFTRAVAYDRPELDLLLRIYHDLQRILGETVKVGRMIIQTIDEQY